MGVPLRVLDGSGLGVVISRVISPLMGLIAIVTPLITTHEPPSTVLNASDISCSGQDAQKDNRRLFTLSSNAEA